MDRPRKPSHQCDATSETAPHGFNAAGDGGVDPRAFGFVKAAYAVGETLELLSIGRTSLYEAVKRGELKPVKFGKKTLFFAADLAAFLARLSPLNEARSNVSGRRARRVTGA
jgi:excisionase family DNA binding protein